MPKPSTWKDTLQARAYEYEAGGLVGPAVDTFMWEVAGKIQDRIADDVLPHLAPSFPTYGSGKREGQRYIPGGERDVTGVLRHAFTTWAFGDVCHTWKGLEGPIEARLRAIDDMIDAIPPEDLQAIFTEIGFGYCQPAQVYVHPDKLRGWLKFWGYCQQTQRGPVLIENA